MQKLLFSVVSACLLATQAAAWERHPMLVPLEVAGACAAKVGASQPMLLDYPVVDGAFSLVQVRPGYGVTETQSVHINACIAHYAGFPVDRVRSLGGKETLVVRFNRCRTGVLVGGDSYCVKNAGY